MSSYTSGIRLSKPAKGDQNWDAEINDNWTALAGVYQATRTFLVSPYFNNTNLPGLASATDRRLFDTIQGAVDAAAAKSYDVVGARVLIYPGTYNEQVTITDQSLTLANVGAGSSGFYIGGPVYIRGNGNAEPAIKFVPGDGTIMRCGLIGLAIDNRYNTNNASEITAEPYALKLADKSAMYSWGSAQNVVVVEDCAIRMQTWGVDNKWQMGIYGSGYWTLNVRRSQIGAYSNSGGTLVGYVRRLFEVEGDAGASKTFTLNILNSVLDTIGGTGAPALRAVYYSNRVQTSLIRSICNLSSENAKESGGGTGNSTRGFHDSNETDTVMHNMFGVSADAF